jgi:hypothetical protein
LSCSAEAIDIREVTERELAARADDARREIHLSLEPGILDWTSGEIKDVGARVSARSHVWEGKAPAEPIQPRSGRERSG